jgi:hypothetical protein
VTLVGNYVKAEILEFEWMRLNVRPKASKNTPAPRIANSAHGVVGEIDSLTRESVSLHIFFHVSQTVKGEFFTNDFEEAVDFRRSPGRWD